MLNAATLNLIESEEKIRQIISEYFGQYNILKWKYEDAVKTLIDANFVMRPTEKNLEKLGNIYLDEAKRVLEISNTEFSKREKEKILGLEESMLEISTATPIKKTTVFKASCGRLGERCPYKLNSQPNKPNKSQFPDYVCNKQNDLSMRKFW